MWSWLHVLTALCCSTTLFHPLGITADAARVALLFVRLCATMLTVCCHCSWRMVECTRCGFGWLVCAISSHWCHTGGNGWHICSLFNFGFD